MKIYQAGLVLVGALTLAGCNSIIQSAADNTAVSVIPLANAKLTGTMSASGATPLSLQAQALYTVPFTSPAISFGDFDPSSLPSALQNPSGLDIPIVISGVTLACAPGASPLTMTVNTLSLTVKDASGSQTVSTSPNTILTLTKTASSYSVSSSTMMLKAKWGDFKSIVTKNGTATPNTATLALNATFNDGALGCLATLNLASTLQQNIRF
ncbi:hypothetical protein EHF33_10225 [Deinococcus psychrotolerans]|uniref:Lipoprotein n=1 Tax=Deinococcus psychrotolerans TaxID=2489213 RepID=A0A3G8YN98_9DEIO|nr:hypothetical protein [Deinococcus psychrotolerans]AZI43071.1 hypothetical protein EHF33_10225 [Deinococcus psychrotolerans]